MSDNSRTGGSGWNWLWTGAKELGTRGNIGLQSEKVDFVNEKSKFMRARSGGFDREIRDMRNRLSPLHRELFGMSAGDMQNFMFWWIQANDQGMAYAVWLGAYRQGLAGAANFDIAEIHDRMIRDGKTEADINNEIERRAVEYADTAAATQASSFAADLTEIQRDRGFMRFMSMFMSGNVRQGSRLLQHIDAMRLGDKTKGDVAYLAVREYVLPSLAWVFMRASILYAASEALGIGGDDEDPLVETLWESLETSAAPWPLLREAPRVARYGVLAGDVPAVKATARAGTDLVGAGKKLTEAEYMLAVGKAMDAAGYAFGIPVMNLLNDFGVSEAAGLKPEKKRSKK